jgi:hypothetical protein
MGPRSIEDAVNKHLQTAGIHDESVQTLRATFAIHTLRQGTSQKVLQDVLDISRWTAENFTEQPRFQMDRQLQACRLTLRPLDGCSVTRGLA